MWTRLRLRYNLDFEKINDVGQMRNELADLSHFKKIVHRLPSHLADPIAAQIHRDTQAMARAKFPSNLRMGWIVITTNGKTIKLFRILRV